ncbi:MAG: hypothetical protein VB050_00840 [Geobacteraceae bacterium]|nr:hypothetical protein [Geobacteraceae bacterium]
MKADRKRTYEEKSPVCARLEREQLNIGRYAKSTPRDPEKRRILLDLAVEQVRRAEEGDYIRIGHRRRKVKL